MAIARSKGGKVLTTLAWVSDTKFVTITKRGEVNITDLLLFAESL